ncbi:MAG: NB-ARC domain-containing protein [Cyanobacteria bacterium P01_A01_bin.84]
MLPHNFLIQIAHEHELSPEQKQVFLMRLGDNQSYEHIASVLDTSPDACLKRMGQVYKKLNVSGSSRGKENRLRISLENKFNELKEIENNLEQAASKKIIYNPIALETQRNDDSKNQLVSFVSPQVTPQLTPQVAQKVTQNLPAREYTTFIGRTEEISRLLKILDFRHSAHLIGIDGIGGVGKTTLAVEAAYRCLEASQNDCVKPGGGANTVNYPSFAAIIFTSAKQNHLTAIGLLPRIISQRTLRDICREITRTLNITETNNLSLQEQIEIIRQRLSQIQTLLIVDNLETIEDKQEVLSFLYDLPPTVKVIITTREQALFVPIRLDYLPKENSLDLIQQQAEEKGITLTNEQAEKLYLGVSGIPAAIIYAIGQIAAGYLLDDVLVQIKDPQGDVTRFCFTASINFIKDRTPHYLLMAISLFVQSVSRETIAEVALSEADPIGTSQGLAKLQQLSLVYQQQGRYSLLNLTREYAASELATRKEFAKKLRERWVKWYVEFSKLYGTQKWKEWHLSYSHLETEWENLRSVLEWCIGENRYADVREIWQHIKGYIHIRGYWDERLDWAAWLIEAAKEAGDWTFALEVMSDRAWTLVRTRQPKHLQEAELLLTEAWRLRHHQRIQFQLDLAANMVILRIHQQQFQEAQNWLNTEETILQEADFSDEQICEQRIHILYYQGQIYYQRGKLKQANKTLQQALEKAQITGWKRATATIQNWLSNIALLQGNLDKARELLEVSFPMVLKHKDKRCIAFHKATFAKLEKLSGNITKAQSWAKEAAEGFENLKMTTEATEMYNLLE